MKKFILVFIILMALPGFGEEKMDGIRLKITAGDKILTATLINNETAQAFLARLPMTVRMEDLYKREMCYHFPSPLPANEARRTGYNVGDISYWPPGKSLVIFYKQNGEIINLQKIGRIDSGVEIFEHTGDIDVRFERF